MSRDGIGRLQLLGTALLFSTAGAAIKATALTNWQVAGFRSGTAAVAILLLVPSARRNWGWRPLLVGVVYAATVILFVSANKLTTAANSIFLQYTAPLYLLLIGPLWLKERIRRADLVLIAVLAAGAALFFFAGQPASATAPDPFRGDLLSLVGGVTWAFTIAGLRWLESKGAGTEAGMTTVAAGNLITFLVCLPLALPVETAATADWLVIAYLGVFQIGLANVLFTRGVRTVSALEASLLLLIEPALNPAWAWLLHRERPAALAVVGAALIMAATIGRLLWAENGKRGVGRVAARKTFV